MNINGLDLPVPDHTHMSRRAAQLAVEVPRRPRKGPIHVVVDSTGLKIFGEGEWKGRHPQPLHLPGHAAIGPGWANCACCMKRARERGESCKNYETKRLVY